MKESDITQPVIDKCKQITELWRMEIYKGCWVEINTNVYLVNRAESKIYQTGNTIWNKKDGIPIPSISDCLEKLQERQEIMPEYYNKKHFDRSLLNIFKNYIKGEFTVEKVHYWLLTALLEVLRG